MAKETLFAVLMPILNDMCASAVRAAWAVCLLIIDFQNLNNIFENTVNISIRKAFYKTEQLIDLIVHVFTLSF
jgi:hypothetical protein